jgi:hypothetical protein
MKVIMGIDPDSNKHGIAIYRDGVLTELLNMNTIQLYKHITTMMKKDDIVIHMENPKATKGVFRQRTGNGVGQDLMIAQKIGMVKQAQTSIEQMADELGIKFAHHRNSKCWKKGNDKVLFERITKWTGRSNEETRSAAYFGWLGCK